MMEKLKEKLHTLGGKLNENKHKDNIINICFIGIIIIAMLLFTKSCFGPKSEPVDSSKIRESIRYSKELNSNVIRNLEDANRSLDEAQQSNSRALYGIERIEEYQSTTGRELNEARNGINNSQELVERLQTSIRSSQDSLQSTTSNLESTQGRVDKIEQLNRERNELQSTSSKSISRSEEYLDGAKGTARELEEVIRRSNDQLKAIEDSTGSSGK